METEFSREMRRRIKKIAGAFSAPVKGVWGRLILWLRLSLSRERRRQRKMYSFSTPHKSVVYAMDRTKLEVLRELLKSDAEITAHTVECEGE